MYKLIFTSILALMITVIPGIGSYQVISLGGHNISLDFGGQNIAIIQMAPDYEDCMDVSTYYVKMVDRNTNSSSFAYRIGHEHPRSMGDLEEELDSIMGALCDKMSIRPYENGYISTGLDRLGGQALWGIIAPLDGKGGYFTTCVEIVASFKNESLNEYIVKTAKL